LFECGSLGGMNKTFHYLSGLPRSGNTVVSSLLNQNPNVHSSGLSPVCEYLWVLSQSALSQENVIRNKDRSSSDFVFSNLLNNYYANIDKPIVFDREKNWGTPANLSLIKTYFTKEPKIVYTVRPIVEILASFISLDTAWIDRSMTNNGWNYKSYLTPDDNRCDYLMRAYGEIDQGLLVLNEVVKEENKDVFHIVEYSDLINNPQETMDSIYNFIGIESFAHTFNNIKKLEVDDDAAIGLPKDLHKVRPELKKTSPKPDDVLSGYTLSKYSNMEFWRK
jgi:sulfotransferase